MKVLVVGEGPGDIGCSEWSAGKGEYDRLPGWLQVILEKLCGQGLTIEAIDRKLLPSPSKKHQPLPNRHGGKALAARLKAKTEKYDLVVFMADTDSKDDGEWKAHYNCIHDGFGKITDGPPAVACLPKSASESWLLADADAWGELGLTALNELPKEPEKLSGKRNDPKGDHPHRIFTRICDMAGVTDSRETRVKVFRNSEPNTLEQKCPLSFAAFRQDLAGAAPAVKKPA
jgi:hypothetical protein